MYLQEVGKHIKTAKLALGKTEIIPGETKQKKQDCIAKGAPGFAKQPMDDPLKLVQTDECCNHPARRVPHHRASLCTLGEACARQIWWLFLLCRWKQNAFDDTQDKKNKEGRFPLPPQALEIKHKQKEQFVRVVVDFCVIYQQEKPVQFLLGRIN